MDGEEEEQEIFSECAKCLPLAISPVLSVAMMLDALVRGFTFW
jgi:hypothetical protein